MIMIHRFKIIILVCIAVLTLSGVKAQQASSESHFNVSMRMIGHEVLLSSGDSTSRVLPVQKIVDKYKIQFASEFAFDPDSLGKTIDRVVSEKQIAENYIVEVVHCETNEIVYSYEIGNVDQNMVPCKGRYQEKGCYAILFTIMDEVQPTETTGTTNFFKASLVGILNSPLNFSIAIIIFLMLGTFTYFWKKKTQNKQNTDLISIGAYKFDLRNMELLFKKERVELTNKEVDLLYLLYTSANTTVERELILKNVWGDEGHYIGRTLDVFISKLRKKLEADSNVKIINIRGVGYKLILNDAA